MAFYESPRFPERISYGARGGPEFSTVVVATVSGREQRNSRWQYPRQRWDVSQGVKTAADFVALRAFFLTMQGRLHGWRFKDWADFEATHSGDGRGVVTGITSTTFQMFKRYTSGAQTVDRKVTKPVTSTVEVKVSGVVVTATVNTVTGVLTIASAPSAANVTWSGQFDVPMRFDTDRLDATVAARNSGGLLHQWDSIPVLEVPL